MKLEQQRVANCLSWRLKASQDGSKVVRIEGCYCSAVFWPRCQELFALPPQPPMAIAQDRAHNLPPSRRQQVVLLQCSGPARRYGWVLPVPAGPASPGDCAHCTVSTLLWQHAHSPANPAWPQHTPNMPCIPWRLRIPHARSQQGLEGQSTNASEEVRLVCSTRTTSSTAEPQRPHLLLPLRLLSQERWAFTTRPQRHQGHQRDLLVYDAVIGRMVITTLLSRGRERTTRLAWAARMRHVHAPELKLEHKRTSSTTRMHHRCGAWRSGPTG